MASEKCPCPGCEPIEETLIRMRKAVLKERVQWGGDAPKMWWIDNMECGSYADLLCKFESKIHDDRWAELWEQPHFKYTEIMPEARAVGYKDAGHRSIAEHYLEGEVESMKRARHYPANWLFLHDELQMYFRRG